MSIKPAMHDPHSVFDIGQCTHVQLRARKKYFLNLMYGSDGSEDGPSHLFYRDMTKKSGTTLSATKATFADVFCLIFFLQFIISLVHS